MPVARWSPNNLDEPRAIVFQTDALNLVIFEAKMAKEQMQLFQGFFRTAYADGWEISDQPTVIVASFEEFAAMASICELAPTDSVKAILEEFIVEQWPHVLDGL